MTEQTISSELTVPIGRACIKTADSAARMLNASITSDYQTDELVDIFVSDFTWFYTRAHGVPGIDTYYLNDDQDRYLLPAIYDYITTPPHDRDKAFIPLGVSLHQTLVKAILTLTEPGTVV